MRRTTFAVIALLALVLPATAQFGGAGVSGPFFTAYTAFTSKYGSVTRALVDRFSDRANILDCGADPTGTVSSQTAVQACVTATNGGEVYAPQGTYLVNAVLLHSGLSLRGAGKGVTIFRQTGASGNAMFYLPGGPTSNDITISDATLDVNGIDSGVTVKDVTRFTARNLRVLNVKTWGIHVGSTTAEASTTTIVNKYITIENSDFDTITQTFEENLVYNASDVLLKGNRYLNGMPSGIGIGLYQNLERVVVEDCLFQNLAIGTYYSVSTNRITFNNDQFVGNTTGIQGANLSDHGAFGLTTVYGLKIANSQFTANSIGLQLGATWGAVLENSDFFLNVNNALVLTAGNATTPIAAKHTKLSNVNFYDNNTSNTQYQLHAAVLFQGNAAGEMDMAWNNVNFWDDQSTQTQLDTITFNGSQAWSAIKIFGGNLPAYGGGSTFSLVGGATVSALDIYGATNFTGAPPAGVNVVYPGNAPATLTVAAAGTTLGAATVLTRDVNEVTSATSGSATGVLVRPWSGVAGQVTKTEIINSSGTTLNVWPPTSTAAIWNLNGASAAGAAGAAATLTNGSHAVVSCKSSTLCYMGP